MKQQQKVMKNIYFVKLQNKINGSFNYAIQMGLGGGKL